MARTIQTFSATTLADLQSDINTFFSANLDAVVLSMDFVATDMVASSGIELGVSIMWDTGAALTTPFTVAAVSGRGLDDVQTQLNAIMALNPAWFYQGPILCNLMQRRRLNDWLALLVVGADVAAAANWTPGA